MSKRFSRKFLIILNLLFSFHAIHAQVYKEDWNSLDKRKTPEWFDEAKLGIFIHWGVYSVPSWAQALPGPPEWGNTIYYAEWYWRLLQGEPDGSKPGVGFFPQHHAKMYGDNFKYQDFANQFKAENFDPNKWADIIHSSGAKYAVLTSKHHEGFALWPSQYSWNWNSVSIGPHRDLVKDVSEAIRKKGLKMGYYYSLYEWYNPTYHSNFNRYVNEYMVPQMKELVESYEPDLIWSDGEWDHKSKEWKSEKFLAWLFNESKVKDKVVVNDRWGSDTRSAHGGYYTTEYGLLDGKEKPTDATIFHKWEECRGIGRSFGYNRNENLEDYLSSSQLLNMFVDIVSKGGNLLLNIGPTADGRIPVIMQQRLKDLGDWLKVNGEAIYGTKRTEAALASYNGKNNIYLTRKGKTLYAIATAWNENSIAIPVENKNNKIKVTLLGSSSEVKFETKEGKLNIFFPSLLNNSLQLRTPFVFRIENFE